jgi:hypothetical protein
VCATGACGALQALVLPTCAASTAHMQQLCYLSRSSRSRSCLAFCSLLAARRDSFNDLAAAGQDRLPAFPFAPPPRSLPDLATWLPGYLATWPPACLAASLRPSSAHKRSAPLSLQPWLFPFLFLCIPPSFPTRAGAQSRAQLDARACSCSCHGCPPIVVPSRCYE